MNTDVTKIRNSLAIIACKLLILAGRLMGKKGSSAPGSIAMKISPGVLKSLASQIKGDIIAVCGTNGKTTTNNMIDSLFSSAGKTVICNNYGANMLPGVACAFISRASITGKLNADCAALECDEASLRHIVKHVTPTKIVVTNLFRDQMDRYGEIESTAALLNEAFEKVPEAMLILNADDPLCAQFGKGRNAVYYGVSEDTGLHGEEAKDGRFCPKCGGELEYEYHHYSQLGKYKCIGCGFERPNPNYSATRVDISDGLKFVLSYKGSQHKLELNYRGFYNIYNIIASFAVYETAGGTIEEAKKVFDDYKPQLGRMETYKVGGKNVILNLAKNPAGFNQAIETVCADKKAKDILIVINDKPSDGTDISWMWDVEFEKLKSANLGRLVVSGLRKYDLGLRFKLCGFEGVVIEDISREALEGIISGNGEVCYILANYTALFETQKILKTMEDK